MDEKRKKHGWAWAIILVTMMLVAYPLSIGPAFAVIGASGCDLTLVYAPLEPFKKVIEPWLDLWDFYGIKRGGC